MPSLRSVIDRCPIIIAPEHEVYDTASSELCEMRRFRSHDGGRHHGSFSSCKRANRQLRKAGRRGARKNSIFASLLQATVQGYGGKKAWNVPTCTLHRLCYNVQYTTRLWQIGSLSAARLKQEIGKISLAQGLATRLARVVVATM